MRINKLTFLPILFLFALTLAACGGTSATATPEVAATTPEPLLFPRYPRRTRHLLPSQQTLSPQATNTTLVSTASVSFIKDVMPIFESRYINCHSNEQTKEGLDLKTYAALMVDWINSGALDN
jgi:hypothetical protein